jgi:hypothetical protein
MQLELSQEPQVVKLQQELSQRPQLQQELSQEPASKTAAGVVSGAS